MAAKKKARANEQEPGAPQPPYEWPRRPRRSGFRPQFTLYLLYMVAAFVVFAMLLILPDLMPVLESGTPGPEQQAEAERVARAAARGRLLPAFALALATVGLGAYYQVLPGTRL